MTAEERLLEEGFEDIIIFKNPSYDDALIGVSEDNRAVYDYYKMVERLMKEEDWTEEEAEDWVNYNTIRALPYMGEGTPIIMFPV